MPAEPASGHLLLRINANEPFFFYESTVNGLS